MDIRENYLNALWMHLFGDASVWVNIGVGDGTTDIQIGSLADLESRGAQSINYQILDTGKINHEVRSVGTTVRSPKPFIISDHDFITATFLVFWPGLPL